MNRSKFIFQSTTLLFLFLLGLTASFAQGPAEKPIEPSYDVVLHVIIGSNDGSGAALPAELSTVSRELKSRFSFSNYRLADTFLGRLANRGDLEYKSVFNLMEPKADSEQQSFLEWSLRGLKGGKDASDKALFQADGFRFGGRIPIKYTPDASKGGSPVMAWEAIGLNLQRLTLSPNTPTLIGTITMTKALGTMFVVITVKSAA